MPSENNVRKNMTAHRGAIGILANPVLYETNANPGPKITNITVGSYIQVDYMNQHV